MNGNEIDDNEYWAPQERQTRELRESLPEDIKDYTAKQITNYLDSLSQEDKDIWVDRIGNDPILQRIIYYVSSPPEDIDLRLRMIAQNDINVDFHIKYNCFVQTLPENSSKVLRLYLRKLTENFLRIFTADCQKLIGTDKSIEALRLNCLRTEKIDGGQKTIIDHSPWTRYELLKTPKEKVMTIYALDESDMSSRFDVDPFLIVWMQTFDNADIRDEAYTDSIEIRIVDKAGNRVEPPKKFRNPFFFSLREKYTPLLKEAFDRFKSQGFIEYEDIESCFWNVVRESQGYINSRSLYWEISSLKKERIRKQKKVPKVPEDEPIVDDNDPKIKETVDNSGAMKPVQLNFNQDNATFLEEEAVDDTYDPSTRKRLEVTSASDPLQSLLNRDIINTAKRDKCFWSLIFSGKRKTDKERQYIHRVREKLKKT